MVDSRRGASVNILYANNTGVDIRMFEAEISAACKAGGQLPEELADTFRLDRCPVDNPDGSPRYALNWV